MIWARSRIASLDALAESGDIEQSSRDQWSDLLAAYDDAAKRARRDVEKALAVELNQQTVKASERAKESFGKAEAGAAQQGHQFLQERSRFGQGAPRPIPRSMGARRGAKGGRKGTACSGQDGRVSNTYERCQ